MAVRTIEVREKVMAKNDELAAEVRAKLAAARVPSLNLVSSPGSGKTLLLERTLAELGTELRFAVVTGDVQTQNDADRLAKHTQRLVQAVVTNGACHLDARQVMEALSVVDLADTDMLFVENVGNLVCPASWDLGEVAKVVVLSVTEGEDKPLKYPKMFRMAEAAVINTVDDAELFSTLEPRLGWTIGQNRDIGLYASWELPLDETNTNWTAKAGVIWFF